MESKWKELFEAILSAKKQSKAPFNTCMLPLSTVAIPVVARVHVSQQHIAFNDEWMTSGT